MCGITFEYVYVVLAVIASIFFGVAAPRLFEVVTKNWSNFTWIHQFWLNFSGSIAGWISFWILWRRVLSAESTPTVELGSWEIFLALVGFIGVTGFLPMTTVDVIKNLGNWLKGKVNSASSNSG
jgi:hypothetical protein